MRRVTLALLSAATVSACAPSLLEEYPFDGDAPHGERVRQEDAGDGVTKTYVDASAKEAWVYFDFDSGRELGADEAFSGGGWDLAFQRFKVITNSGVSGSGDVATAVLEGASFDAVDRAPLTGYQRDRQDGADANSDLDSPFLEGDGWYAYNLLEHRLAPREVVYVVKTTEHTFLKVQMLGYYDAAGSPGQLSFRWKPVAPPDP